MDTTLETPGKAQAEAQPAGRESARGGGHERDSAGAECAGTEAQSARASEQAKSPSSHEKPAPLRHWVLMTLAVAVPFVGTLVALATAWLDGGVAWLYLNMVIVGWLLTGLGITVGYHRLVAHRSFQTYPWLRNVWIALGALSVQKSPLEWCTVHRWHHSSSDRAGDPHSPQLKREQGGSLAAGLWHAQVGWLFTNRLLSVHKERYAPDLINDRFAMWVHEHYDTLWIPASLLIPALAGGLIEGSARGAWMGFLWGGLVRIFVVHHITWSINSICHVFGRRDYDLNDSSRNNVLCALLGHGEGWHNNHHAFPSSARQGLRPWQIDLSWWVIRGMERLGLAWNVRLPSDGAMAARAPG